MDSKNFFIIFGAIWTAIIAFITFIILFISGMTQNVIESTDASSTIGISVALIPMLAFMSIFWAIGIIILVIGIKKYKTDKATEKFGDECYAKIVNVYPSGTTVNGRREFKADFLVYVSMSRAVKKIAEIIGFDPVDFPVNSYARVKYYNNDINIKEIISVNSVPVNIRDAIESYKKQPIANDYNIKDDYSGYDDYTSNNDDDSGPISYK